MGFTAETFVLNIVVYVNVSVSSNILVTIMTDTFLFSHNKCEPVTISLCCHIKYITSISNFAENTEQDDAALEVH